MADIIKTLFIVVITSLYYFPVEFYALPGINTKMLMAVIGIFFVISALIKNRKGLYVQSKFLAVALIALVFSLWSYFSVVYNNTSDYVYCTYFISFSVWLFGAVSVVNIIRLTDGYVTLSRLFECLSYVCLVQCVLALMIDNMPEFAEVIDKYVNQDNEFLHETKRLYGIGASFDTAGIRFSCVLLGCAYLIGGNNSRGSMIWYWVIFIAITIIGNIISRTTLVGAIVGIAYLILQKSNIRASMSIDSFKSKLVLAGLVVAIIAVTVYFYNANPVFRHYMEYGFEGFFNWVNNGEWSTSSTSRLQTMIRWPDNLKTWLIGDGLFEDPYGRGFYMFTDIGYLRLIFYCGIIGLFIFTSLFVVSTIILCKESPKQKSLFILLCIINMVVWMKISTDIFAMFALLLALSQSEINNLEDKESPTDNFELTPPIKML